MIGTQGGHGGPPLRGLSLSAGAGRLLVALALVAALAASTPVACWCAPDDHAGQTLHPLFAHVHSHADDAGGEVAADWTETTGWAGWNVAAGHGAPSWSGGGQAVAPVPLGVFTHPRLGTLSLEMLPPSGLRLAPTAPPPR